ncbi:rhombosortase [Piscinibacter koreensis]|uniref:Rhombosortase n=1 Tax=Piscinibacter koreensis TaxID=2742824 RepID=A0A7Y6NJZ4_9BURK|nr:rhombosortase [Schlegelella koreensis]NUZ04588.1 rhombosortase [Schlegelella koreensis]
MTRAEGAWAGLAALLGIAALAVGWWGDPSQLGQALGAGPASGAASFGIRALDWQPGLAAAEPWRAWTAASVHFSLRHLVVNVGGAALVALLGVIGAVPRRMVVAWFVAWPLTHVGLLLRPELAHYGGLSGVLHAGVAVAAFQLVVAERGVRRAIGAAILAGVVLKVLNEAPWGATLRRPAGWDIAVAPLAHATGLVSGVLCAALAQAWARVGRRRARGPGGLD